jgi:hypothetical protein
MTRDGRRLLKNRGRALDEGAFAKGEGRGERRHMQLWPTDFGQDRRALLKSEGIKATKGKSLP